MAYVVLVAWVIQAAAGTRLLVGWLRHGGRGPIPVVVHVSLGVIALGLWIGFLSTGSVIPAWAAFMLITIGNSFGDWMLVQRWRRMSGSSSGFWSDYGNTVGAAFRGNMPPTVVFHALFSAVVYFTCLGVCIGVTVA